jgi:PAS domain-containing protein
MLGSSVYGEAQNIRMDLTALFQSAIAESMSALGISMDREIEQEIRERIAVLIFDEIVNDMPMVPYLAVWEDGANEITHAYMSPKIEALCDYTPQELQRIGYIHIVRGDIISFYRERSGVEENVNPISEAKQKRVTGFLENKNWEGCYRIEKKDGKLAWVIDRSTITRFRNTVKNNIICLSAGILLETTELLEKREKGEAR